MQHLYTGKTTGGATVGGGLIRADGNAYIIMGVKDNGGFCTAHGLEVQPETVEEIATAEWFVATYNNYNSGECLYYCDKCHAVEPHKTRFCPSCGRKMKGGESCITAKLKDVVDG